MHKKDYIKTNRIFTPIRRYGWIFTLVVAIGGLWYPKLGLLVIGIMLSLALMGFFKGRYWCGNYCTHGSLYDLITLPLSANREIPKILRTPWAALLMLSWFILMFGSRLMEVFKLYGSASFIDQLGYTFVITYLVVTIIGSLLAVFISPRTWCYICPMGTMQLGVYKLSKLLGVTDKHDEKILLTNQAACKKCGKCAKVCPMQLAPYNEVEGATNQLDNQACIRCSTCVNNCPAAILQLSKKI